MAADVRYGLASLLLKLPQEKIITKRRLDLR
jgi:hypothetical protein